MGYCRGVLVYLHVAALTSTFLVESFNVSFRSLRPILIEMLV